MRKCNIPIRSLLLHTPSSPREIRPKTTALKKAQKMIIRHQLTMSQTLYTSTLRSRDSAASATSLSLELELEQQCLGGCDSRTLTTRPRGLGEKGPFTQEDKHLPFAHAVRRRMNAAAPTFIVSTPKSRVAGLYEDETAETMHTCARIEPPIDYWVQPE